MENWALWGFMALFSSILMGGGAIFSLITQPPKPNCSFVVWPFAPASVRLYCAQELTTEPTLEHLIEAIALVDALDVNHPLRGAINPRIEAWSEMLLDRAETTFNAGEIDRAMEYANKIPNKTKAFKLVQERTSRWRRIWAEGEAIDARVAFALKEEDWRKAFGLMVDFLYIDNRYWSQTQYQTITDIIIQAQKDEKNVVEAENFLKAGGFDNLGKSLGQIRELPSDTIFTLSQFKIFNGVAEKLVKIAETALEREDLTEAIDALSYIPRESRLWDYSQDLSKIANATSLTWAVSSDGYMRAIKELGEVPKTSRLYPKAQALIQRWESQIASVKVLEEAQLKALSGDPKDLLAAIAVARQITRSSDKWEMAQENIHDWSNELERNEDQPILDLADELSVPGNAESLRSAIVQAQKIGPSRLLFEDAQSRISYWRSRLDDLAAYNAPPTRTDFSRIDPPSTFEAEIEVEVEDSLSDASDFDLEVPELEETLLTQAENTASPGSPQDLQAAMDLANQVPLNALDRENADAQIDIWGNQLLALAVDQADVDPQSAIDIAQLLPAYSSQYNQAQQLIERLNGAQALE